MGSMRSIQNLDINLGLFGFQVKVYKGSDDSRDAIAFRQLHRDCLHPIHQVKRCASCNKDVPHSDLAKGYEVESDRFVVVDEAELKALKPERSGQVTIDGYVMVDEIEPANFAGPVFILSPGGKDAAAFVTWRDALAGRYALGRVILYGREQIVAIRAFDRLLSMHPLRPLAEIRKAANVPGYDGVPLVSSPEHRALMAQVIERDEISLDQVSIAEDGYVVAVKALIKAKWTGEPMDAVPVKPVAQAMDIMAALKASLEAPKKTAVA